MNPEILHAYLDGELTPDEAREVERLLAADPALAERLEELRVADRLLGELPAFGPGEGFTTRLLREARLERALETLPGHDDPAFAGRVLAAVRRGRRRGALLRLAAPLAVAAAVLVAVVVLPAGRTDPEPAVAAAIDYAWENDLETFGSLALTDQEDEILAELGAT